MAVWWQLDQPTSKRGLAKTGTSYELLTKALFQDILDQTSAQTIAVEHDVVLQGATTKHQIDVYWEFKLAGIVYQTIVQAKDWAHPVDQGELLKFAAVLDDLPGQPRGLFVTRSGYQKGAKDVAVARGILLYELYEDLSLHITVVAGGWVECRIAAVGDAPLTIVLEYVICTCTGPGSLDSFRS